MLRSRSFVCLFVAAMLAMLPLTACDDTSAPEEQEEEQTELANPNPPGSNDLVTGMQILGDADKYSTIWDMDGDRTNGFVYEGVDNSLYCAGSLTATGTQEWVAPITFIARHISAVQSARFTGAIAVGYREPGGDEKTRGIIALVDLGGNISDQVEITDAAADLSIADAVLLDDSLLFCVGGAEILDTRYPLLALVRIDPDATLHPTETAILDAMPDVEFKETEIGVVLYETQKHELYWDCYLNGARYEGENRYLTLHRIHCQADSLEKTGVAWERDVIVYPGMSTWSAAGVQLHNGNGNLYVAGQTHVNKDPAPGNGGYWAAGMIASFTTDGDENWILPVVLSEYSDFYYDLYLTDDALYAAGVHSWFVNLPTDRKFGNGLLSRFDLTTGAAQYHLSFGDAHYRSGLNAVYVEGTNAVAAGWTHERVTADGYQGWFTEIDLSSPGEAARIIAPAVTGAATVSSDHVGRDRGMSPFRSGGKP